MASVTIYRRLPRNAEDWKECAFEYAIKVHSLAWKSIVMSESLFDTYYPNEIEEIVDIFGYKYVKEKLQEAIHEKDNCEETQNCSE